MSRVNLASLRIGSVAALATLLFWSVWHFTVSPVPVVRALLLVPESTFVLPDWQVLGLSVWSRWLDVPAAGLYAAALTQITMRAEEKDEPVFNLVVGLVVGLVAVGLSSTGLGAGLSVGLSFSLVVGLFFRLFFGLGVGLVAIGLGASLSFGLFFGLAIGLGAGLAIGLGAGLGFGLRFLFTTSTWRSFASWLTAR